MTPDPELTPVPAATEEAYVTALKEKLAGTGLDVDAMLAGALSEEQVAACISMGSLEAAISDVIGGLYA